MTKAEEYRGMPVEPRAWLDYGPDGYVEVISKADYQVLCTCVISLRSQRDELRDALEDCETALNDALRKRRDLIITPENALAKARAALEKCK
jgi:hypothetical protein